MPDVNGFNFSQAEQAAQAQAAQGAQPQGVQAQGAAAPSEAGIGPGAPVQHISAAEAEPSRAQSLQELRDSNAAFVRHYQKEKLQSLGDNSGIQEGRIIPPKLHHYWGGGPLNDSAMNNLDNTRRVAPDDLQKTLWTSKEVNEGFDAGDAAKRARMQTENLDNNTGFLSRASRALLGKFQPKEEVKVPSAEVRGNQHHNLQSLDASPDTQPWKIAYAESLSQRSADDFGMSEEEFNTFSEQLKKDLNYASTQAAILAAGQPNGVSDNDWAGMKGHAKETVTNISDEIRLAVLLLEGGTYLDVDMGIGTSNLSNLHEVEGKPLAGSLVRDLTDNKPETLKLASAIKGNAERNEQKIILQPGSNGVHEQNAKLIIDTADIASTMLNGEYSAAPKNEHVKAALMKLVTQNQENGYPTSGMSLGKTLLNISEGPDRMLDLKVKSAKAVPTDVLDREHITPESKN